MAKTNIIDRIKTAAESFIVSRAKNSSIFNEYYNRTAKKAEWSRQSTFYNRKLIGDWITSVTAATDPINPRRGMLMRFNQSLMLDPHLSGVINTRILRTTRSSFKIVNEKGVENDELKGLLERPWYDDLVKLVLSKNFQGTTLIELFDVDENGELTRVTEIPQSNYIPQKGIIIKEEYDETGVSYKEGFYKDYYVQVGGDWELGLLNQLAMIVLAKKLALGSWISFIEKYGVPPLFAITDRLDSTRRDELFDMLENFRSNHFAVLQGNETITIPANYNVDGYQSYKALINDICNNEISKSVLGGSATTDVKSFVGSAEVQERVAQDRYEADKLLFKYYFNSKIRHSLAKLSSKYAAFATHQLVWDNQETLNIEEYINGVKELSAYYEFDVDEIKKRTGLPVIGKKQQIPEERNVTAQKKKPSINALHVDKYTLFAATWDAAIERLANAIYNGEVKPADLDKDLVLKNYASLNKEANDGWGNGYYESTTARSIRENLFKFSGAKAFSLMEKINDLASTEVTKESFIAKAKQTVTIHNETWMDVEKKFAANAASSARDFEQYIKDIDIYQYLKLRTFGDENVRDSHRANEGIIKPVNQWKVIPPFDPGCRCWLEQTNEPPTLDRDVKGVSQQWGNNPAFTGKIFTPEHSYFVSARKSKNMLTNAEKMKVYIPYSRSIKVNDHKVFINDFSDTADTVQNIEAAKILCKELKTNIYIRPHVNNVKGFKNPELGIGTQNKKGDLKTYNPTTKDGNIVTLENFLINSISSANKQGANYLIVDISNNTDDYKTVLKRRLVGGLNNINRNIKEVIVINNNRVSRITRGQVNNGKFKAFIDNLG